MALVAIAAFFLSLRRSKDITPPQNCKQANPRERVTVTFTPRSDTNFSFEVDPWEVVVTRGRPLRWELTGPRGSTIEIKPKDENDWPFPPFTGGPVGGPNRPVQAGNANQNANRPAPYRYSIILKHDGKTFDIDPEIYIWM
ncbi:MAG: hypothetical protein WEA09_09490 [Gemmatimonadota bacterium]